MKKIVLDLAVSLDGFIEGPNGEIDWCIMEEDMDFEGFLSGIDTIFYGRVSYDAWGNFQPAADADAGEKLFWENIHAKKKVVFSSQEREDGNASFISKDISARVEEIKRSGGKDIWLYGGASLIHTFIDMGLVDRYRIAVHPLVLGQGKPLFENLRERLNLKLAGTRAFRSGVVQLIYERAE